MGEKCEFWSMESIWSEHNANDFITSNQLAVKRKKTWISWIRSLHHWHVLFFQINCMYMSTAYNVFISHNITSNLNFRVFISLLVLINLPLHFPNINNLIEIVTWTSFMCQISQGHALKSIDFTCEKSDVMRYVYRNCFGNLPFDCNFTG